MAQEMEKRINEVCVRILAASKSELYLHMRFLDVALAAFSYVQDPEMETLGTDGVYLYYDPAYLGGLYRRGRGEVNRACFTVYLPIRGRMCGEGKKGLADCLGKIWRIFCGRSPVILPVRQ